MTEALKPSELFGLRWRSLDDQNALPLYRNGVAANAQALRQDSGHLTKVYPPDGLAYERTLEDAGSVGNLRHKRKKEPRHAHRNHPLDPFSPSDALRHLLPRCRVVDPRIVCLAGRGPST